jgi:4-cresol dehydrogenase (hydroxylating) flavoprotein subunit
MSVSRTAPVKRKTPGQDGHRSALDAAVRVVGSDRVIMPPGGRADPALLTLPANVGMYRQRDVLGVIQPRTVEEVCRVVEIFAAAADGGALHPISTGYSWGLGSREPALDNAVVLDLADLDQVRDLDIAGGWAVVEPGVTQGRLAELLTGTNRMVNVTASSAHTSFLGNSIDRGVGLRSQRVDDVVGLEVVLPSGDLLHVGWWPQADRATPVYPHGLGPALAPLFFQSNLGVVTAAVIRLLPRPEAQRVIRLSFSRDVLTAAVDELRRWTAQGLVRGVLKVYDPTSAEFYGGEVGEFLAHVCVDGTRTVTDALTAAIAHEAAESGLFSELSLSDETDSGHKDDVVANMVIGAYSGDPSNNDVMLERTLGQTAKRIDSHGLGWLFFLPLVPFSGDAIATAHRLLGQIRDETGTRCGATINALSADVIDFVVSIKFNRSPDDTERAHRALDLAYELFYAAGFIPYRIDVDHFYWMDRLSSDASSRAFVRRLKNMLDPNGAIAQGRYA